MHDMNNYVSVNLERTLFNQDNVLKKNNIVELYSLIIRAPPTGKKSMQIKYIYLIYISIWAVLDPLLTADNIAQQNPLESGLRKTARF